ncbi:MAG: ABC transporter substrate-binding protein [Betaproteobacteria bacterium]|nr:ABC transporter substrate-binding protein [Betaproteobacteria bacterium]
MISNKPASRLVAMLLVALSVLVGDARSAPQEELKIGVLFPLSGDAASYGARGKNGIELAAAELNAEGGVRGRKLRIIYEDSRAEPRAGVAAMTKLVSVDRVPVVIGDIVSAVTLAVAPIAEKRKVVLLSPTASAPAISDAGDYIFRIWPSDLAEGKEIATFAAKTGFKRISILFMQNDYGIGIKDIFTRVFTAADGKVLQVLGYKPDESDFRPYLNRIGETRPDAIYLVGYYKDSALVLKQARELGLNAKFLGTTAIEDPKLIEIAGESAEGLIYPLATGYDAQSSDTLVQSFRTKYIARYKVEPDWVPAQTYDALMLVAHAIRKGGVTGPNIQKILAGLKGYQGITGEITFDAKGDVVKPVTIKIVRAGKFEKLK